MTKNQPQDSTRNQRGRQAISDRGSTGPSVHPTGNIVPIVPAMADEDSVLEPAFFERDVETVARDLIGVSVFVQGVGGKIVETEAYDAHDPAAHSFRGPTPRNAAMFGPAGRAYVYRSYGIHWCMNFTCGHGAGVLIRAVQPEAGLEVMRARRGLANERLLCAGPGRLCQALGVDASFGGLPLDRPPFQLSQKAVDLHVIACPRIGISVATDTLRRFCQEGSRYLSRPIPGFR